MAINIPIFSSLDSKGFDKLKREFRSLETTSEKAAFVLKKAMLPAAAAIGGVATALGHAAMAAAEDEKSQAAFERQVRSSVGALNGQIESLNEYVTATQMATGVSDTLVRQGLGNLLRATKDQTQAQKLMNISLDISAATGKDLESVTLAMSKAATGQVSALKRLGIPLDENIIKTKDFEAATQQLTDVFGGAASANAKTFQGRLQILKERLGEMWESIGYRVLPALTKMVEFVDRIAAAIGKDGLAGGLAVLRGGLQSLTRSTDGTINGFGNFVNTLITVRNAIAHVVNVLIRMYNVLPFLDNIGTIGMIEQLTTNFGELQKAMSGVTTQAEKQQKLNTYMGPVASRNVDELTNHFEAYKETLRFTTDATDELEKATSKGGGAIKKKTAAVREQAKAVKEELAKAYETAVDALKDQFTPALKDANDKLTAAQDIYNGFYKSIRDSITQVVDLGSAWREAADSEGAKTFFGVLKDQGKKAKDLAFNLSFLISRGLDDPTLLKSITDAGVDTGLEITNAIMMGGEDGIKDLKNLTAGVSEAADYVAKAAADKWYKAGVDQAQALVDGVNKVIGETEFALKFTMDASGVAGLTSRFTENIGRLNAGQAPAPMFDPGSFSAAAFAALGQPASASNVRTSSVNINVNGGDPNAVVDALRRYMQQNGSVPIKTTG